MSDSFTTSWTVACQASLSMGSCRQEYWNELPFHPPGDLPDPGIEPLFPVLTGRFYRWATREAHTEIIYTLIINAQTWCSVIQKSWFTKRLTDMAILISGTLILRLFWTESVLLPLKLESVFKNWFAHKLSGMDPLYTVRFYHYFNIKSHSRVGLLPYFIYLIALIPALS